MAQSVYVTAGTADKLEDKAAGYAGASHCVLVDSPARGLLLALYAGGVKDGDYVICSPLGDSYVPEAIRELGAVPVFADVNPNTFNMDPFFIRYIAGKFKREKKPPPKAVVASDLFGLPCNYESLTELCCEYGMMLVEDMRTGFGASSDFGVAGSMGRFAVASFFDSIVPTEELGCDGAVFCHNEDDARALRELRSRYLRIHSENKRATRAEEVHYVLLEKLLERTESEAEARKKIARWYRQRLTGRVRMQEPGVGYISAYTHFAVALKNGRERDAVMQGLISEHIPCTVYCPMPLHRRAIDQDWERVILVNAEQVCKKLLLLPMHPYLSEHAADFICGEVLKAAEGQYYRSSVPG